MLVSGHMSHRFEDDVRAVTAGAVTSLLDTVIAALGDDIGGTEFAAEVGPFLVPAHHDDLLGAEPLGGKDHDQPDGCRRR